MGNYEIIMNVSGEVHRVFRHAKTPEKAFRLARIEVARRTGHVPSPWAIRVDDYKVKEIFDGKNNNTTLVEREARM